MMKCLYVQSMHVVMHVYTVGRPLYPSCVHPYSVWVYTLCVTDLIRLQSALGTWVTMVSCTVPGLWGIRVPRESPSCYQNSNLYKSKVCMQEICMQYITINNSWTCSIIVVEMVDFSPPEILLDRDAESKQ